MSKKKLIGLILAAALVFALAGGCASAEEDMRIYEYDGVRLPVPAEYDELLLIEVGSGGALFSVSEKASVEAAKELGDDYAGAGFLFAVARISEEELNLRRCGYMTGEEVIARGPDGNCYFCYVPTDVRFVRESYEGIGDGTNEGWKQWTMLTGWAYKTMPEDFVAENEGFAPLRYGNSDVEMYLARAAYDPEAEYLLSTAEFGPLQPGDVDAAPFVERLTRNVRFEYAQGDEAPGGEYAILLFPGDKLRFDTNF